MTVIGIPIAAIGVRKNNGIGNGAAGVHWNVNNGNGCAFLNGGSNSQIKNCRKCVRSIDARGGGAGREGAAEVPENFSCTAGQKFFATAATSRSGVTTPGGPV